MRLHLHPLTQHTRVHARRYNKLFGALAANVNELNSSLGIASEELYGQTVGDIVRGEESTTSSALRSPRREGSKLSIRSDRLSARTRRVQTHGQLPYAGIGAYARNTLADAMLPKPEMSSASWALNQASLGSMASSWASTHTRLVAPKAENPLKSLRELSGNAPAFKSLFADQSWADDALQDSLQPSVVLDRVDSRLVRATMHNTSRVTELNLETLVVHVDLVRVRDVVVSGDNTKLALVVALGENSRCVPLTMKTTNRFLNASVSAPFKAPTSFDFRFDGVLDDASLYVGVHRCGLNVRFCMRATAGEAVRT
jgi:hypothetical protein